MNRIFKRVWNASLQQWVVASELASGHRPQVTSAASRVVGAVGLSSALALAVVSMPVYAADPQLGSDENGNLILGDVPPAVRDHEDLSDSVVVGNGNDVGDAAESGHVLIGNGNSAGGADPDPDGLGHVGIVGIGSDNVLEGNYSIGIGYGNSGLGSLASYIDGYGVITVEEFQAKVDSGEWVVNDDGTVSDSRGEYLFTSDGFGLAAGRYMTGEASIALGVGNTPAGDRAVAVGSYNIVEGDQSVAIGLRNMQGGVQSVALGVANAVLESTNAVAIGQGNTVAGDQSIAIGNESVADADNTVAVGNASVAEADDTIAIGHGAVASAERSAAIGYQNVVSGDSDSFAFGSNNTVDGVRSTAVGTSNRIGNGDGTTAIGYNNSFDDAQNSVAMGSFNSGGPWEEDGPLNGYVAIGNWNVLEGEYSIGIGEGNSGLSGVAAYVEGFGVMSAADITAKIESGDWVADEDTGDVFDRNGNLLFNTSALLDYTVDADGNIVAGSRYVTGYASVALGMGNHASGERAIGVGSYNIVGGDNAASVGVRNVADGDQSAVFGSNNVNVEGDRSVAVGQGNTVAGDQSIAIGNESVANADNTVAVGNASVAEADDTIAIGHGAVASAERSAAIGYQNVVSGDSDSFAFGSSNTVDGVRSTAVGTHNTIENGDNTTIVGVNNIFEDVQNSIALGSYNTAGAPGQDGVVQNGYVAVGNWNVLEGEYSIGIGEGNSGLSAVAGYVEGLGVVSVQDLNANVESGVWELEDGTGNVLDANGALLFNTRTLLDLNEDENGALAWGERYYTGYASVALGMGNHASGERAIGVGSYNIVGGDNAVSVGVRNVADGDQSAVFGSNNVNLEGDRGVAVGQGNTVSGDQNVAIGNENKAEGSYDNSAFGARNQVAGYQNTALGVENEVVAPKANGDEPLHSTALGVRNTITGGDRSVAIGHENQVGELGWALGSNNQVNNAHSIALGDSNVIQGQNSVAIGRSNQTTGADHVTAVGADNVASASDSTAVGRDNRAAGGNATAVGRGNIAAGAESIALGARNEAAGDQSVALGNASSASAASATAIGNTATASANNAIALGSNASAAQTGAVALGAGSVTEAAVGTETATVEDITYGGFAGTTPASTVSVGAEGAERTVTNVAAGRISDSSTDAINGSQLFATQTVIGNVANSLVDVLGGDAAVDANGNVTMGGDADGIGGTGETTIDDAIAYASQGWDVSANGEAGESVGAGGSVDFSNTDGNIEITRTGTDLAFELADEIDVDSVTAGDTVLDGTGVAVGDDVKLGDTGLVIEGGPSVTVDGINAGGQVISGVEAGVADTDAVNVGQLNNSVAASKTHYYSVNDNGVQGGNYNNDGATGLNALAAGKNAAATGDGSVAMGFGAQARPHPPGVINPDVTGLNSGLAVAIGNNAISGNYASIALGANSQANKRASIAIGYQAEVRWDGSELGNRYSGNIAIGNRAYTGAGAGSATVVGSGASADGGNIQTAIGAGATARSNIATALGANSIANGDTAIAVGVHAQSSGYDSAAIGTASTAGRTATGSSSNAASALGVYSAAQGTGASAIGSGAFVFGNGSGNVAATNAKQPRISWGAKNDTVFSIVGGNENFAVGNRNLIGGTSSNNVAFGNDIKIGASGATFEERTIVQNGVTMRYYVPTFADQVAITNAVAIGQAAGVGGNDAVAIGSQANAAQAGAVALGAGSVTEAAVGTETATVGGLTYGSFAGTTPASTVSVGAAGAERTVTNVAAGRISDSSTDAINGSQLFATQTVIGNVANSLVDVLGGDAAVDADGNVTMGGDADGIGGTGAGNIDDAIAYASQGWDVSANGEAGENVGPGGSVDFSNTDGNIEITRTGTDLNFDLAENIDLGEDGSVTIGDTVIADNSITVGDTVIDGDSITTTNLTVEGDTQLGDNFTVNDGGVYYDGPITEDTHIVNKGYVDQEVGAIADTPLTFAGDAGTNVERRLGETVNLVGGADDETALTAGNIGVVANGDDTLEVKLNKDLDLTEDGSVAIGDTQVDGTGVAVGDDVKLGDTGLVIEGGPSVTVDGINAGGQIISGVDAGVADTDAVNVGQLNDTVETNRTKYYSVNSTGGGNFDNEGATGADAIAAGKDAEAEGDEAVAMGLGASASGDGSLAFGAAAQAQVLNGIALGAGAVAGHANSIALGAGSATTVGAQANYQGAYVGDSSSTGELNIGGRQITGVAAGSAPTDAVNVSQLQAGVADAVNQSNEYTDVQIGDVNNRIDQIDDRVTTIEGDIIDIRGDITDIQGDIVDIHGDITDLDGRLTDVEGDVANIVEVVGEVDNRLTRVENGADGMFQVSQEGDIVKPKATGENSSAGGNGAVASGDNALAVGNQSSATGNNSTAVGTGATASGDASTALGQGAKATHGNSVALGAGSATTVGAQTDYDAAYVGRSSSTGEVNVGGRTITGVAPGIAGTDAVNVNQLNAGVNHAITSANQYTDSRISQVENDMWTLDRGYRGATASAMAMAGLPQAYLPGKSMLSVGFGGYQSEYGMAVGMSGITENGRWVYKAQASGNTAREWGFSLGAGIQW